MNRPDESTLHALVDGQLSAAEAARLEAALQDLPEQLALVQAWRAQKAGLQRLAEAAEPIDAATVAGLFERLHDNDAEVGLSGPAVKAVASRLQSVPGGGSAAPAFADGRQSNWTRFALAAAVAGIAWCAGWYGRGLVYPHEDIAHGGGRGGTGAAALGANIPTFVREASSAYAVFTPEVRHPVEVTAGEQDHLVQWLSRRLGRPLRVPDLAGQGYQLLGGRLLPAAEGMGAMFMYQMSTGERLSLYMTVLAAADPPGDTAFRFSDAESGTTPTFYWVDRDFGYAVSAKLPRDRVMAIARQVYAQTVEASGVK